LQGFLGRRGGQNKKMTVALKPGVIIRGREHTPHWRREGKEYVKVKKQCLSNGKKKAGG